MPPNILLVVTDQQRPDLVGALGRVPVRTPALDRLCAEGTAFTRAYTPCPLCTPTRASLITGQYPSRHGAWTVGTALRSTALSLPRELARAGYRTAIIGKSHLNPGEGPGSPEAIPQSRDWAHFGSWSGPWYGFEHARICVGHVDEPHAYGMHYGLHLHRRGVPPEPPYFQLQGRRAAGSYAWALPEALHQSAWVADETIAWLDSVPAGQPFFGAVHFPDPHLPFRVSEPWDRLHDDVALPPPRRRLEERDTRTTLYRATIAGDQAQLGWHERFGMAAEAAQRGDQVARNADEAARWRVYMGMTSLMDAHLGRILDQLDQLGRAEDTLVVFSSDHGDHMGDHWLWYKGGNHFDAAVRVPFIVRWPGQVPAGAQCSALLSLVDLPRSFLAVAGRRAPARMQGVDQREAWLHGRAQRSGVWIDHRCERGLRVDSWITDQHRLSVHQILAEARDECELYDFGEDPEEYDDRAARDPATVARLMAEMLRYRAANEGPLQRRSSFA